MDEEALHLAVRHELWRRGELTWKLDEGQQGWVERFNKGDGNSVWLIARQRGKSFASTVDDVQFALKNPGSIVRYCAKTKDSAWGIVGPALQQICIDKPDDVRMKLSTQRADVMEIGEGSELVIFGTDAQSFDRGRGPRTHRQKFDEVAFYQDLERVEAALLPALQTTNGKALYLSSPPESMGHPFVQRVRAAMGSGRFEHDTFWSNPRINHEAIIQKESERLGMTREEFLKSTYFLREYEARLVTEESRAAVPAWTEALAAKVVVERERPKFYDAYDSLDPGFGDPHAALFAYLDFERSKLVIEDELELRGVNTKVLADAFKAKEAEVWGIDRWNGTLRAAAEMDDLPEWLGMAVGTNAPAQPYMRVGDGGGLGKLTLVDFHQQHGVTVLPTAKDEKHLQLDAVDVLFRQHRIEINPRCKRLIAQLYTTIWNKQRTEFERTPLDHGDLIDNLIYIVRNVRWHRDPKPKHYGVDFANTWVADTKDDSDVFGSLFGK